MRLCPTNVRPHATLRELGQPAATLAFGHEYPRWVLDDGSTVRTPVSDVAVLQTFPADYPWSGNVRSRWRQVGDAVPPLLARVLVGDVAGVA